jgi:hypothetical protein
MGLSDYLEGKLIDHLLRGIAFTPPSTLYISLHTGDPGEAGANELSAGGYARHTYTSGTTKWSNVSGTSKNSVLITFPVSTSSWGTITHFGIWDAATGGNLLFSGALTNSRAVSLGDTVSFPVDFLNIDFD